MAQIRRKRTLVRADQRAQAKLMQDREKLFQLQPGGSAQHPLDVASASTVEARAESIACPQCITAVPARPLQVLEHSAQVVRGARLRRVKLRCPNCGVTRAVWFRILPSLLN